MGRLRELRERKHLNQHGLAMKLNTSQSTISAYEIGARSPDIETLIHMAEFFDVSVDYLVGKTDIKRPMDPERLAPEDANLLSDIQKLDRHQKEKVQAYIAGLLST